MTTLQIDILNPKAKKLLQDLADLDLISIGQENEDEFLTLVNRIRNKAADIPPTFEEITEEVESVRADRYANRKQ